MNIREAIRFLQTFSKSYDVWSLMGDRNKKNRQVLMFLITGEKLPQAKCGVTAIREKLWEIADITNKGYCIADREDLFKQWCEQYENIASSEAKTA